MIGKTVLHYKIIEKLGEGGMGVVYKAEDTKLKREVAIKFLPRQIASSAEERERFKIEAQAAAALNHPNIATIHAIEEHDDELFIVMEFIEGRELREVIYEITLGFPLKEGEENQGGTIPKGPQSSPKASRRGERDREIPTELSASGLRASLLGQPQEGGFLPIDAILDYAIQIAEGLQAAHEKGIVHRDIKSANIMVTPSGQVKIMDFGLAKIGAGAQLTREQSTLGTVAYMSPEQTRGETVDHRSDIWSFGVVLYEMLTGELPFRGEYEQAVIYSILNEEPNYPDNIPENLKLILKKSLQKDISKRYQQIEQLLSDLKLAANGKQSAQSRLNPKTSRQRKRVFLPTGVAVIILLIASMGILFYPQKGQGKKIITIAILPFSNTKTDPETDYLGFALADQIIGDLAYLKSVIVRPSSSIRKYEKQVNDPIITGDELEVEYILMGNYLKEAKNIRLNVELIQVNSNELIWREPIEVEYKDVFKLQDIVSEKVIKGLRIQFSQDEMDRLQSNVPQNPLAYEYYLRSISYPSTIEGEQLAIEMLKKSIELDSSYAPAFHQLGFRTQRLAQFGLRDPKETARAEKYYLKALSLNGELLSALADLSMLYTETARTEEAVELTKQVLQINPNNASAHFSLGYIYRYAGMLHESKQEMEKAVAIDPRNSRFRTLGITYMNLGEYEKAYDAFDFDEGSPYSLGWHGHTLFRQGKQEQAIEYFDRVIAMEPEGLWGRVAIALKAYIQGNTQEGLNATQKLEQANIADAEGWYYWAGFYGLFGDRTGCIRALQRAVDGGYFNYPFMFTDFFFDSVRDDPEFQEILQIAKQKHLAFKKKFFPENR